MKRLIIISIIIAAACSVGFGQKKKKDKYKTPQVQIPVALDRTSPASPLDAQSLADLKWFEVFKDEKLQALIREALMNNYDLRQSVARVESARASLGITRADQFPTIEANGGGTFQGVYRKGDIPKPLEETKHPKFGEVLLNLLTFELDIWGRLRKATQAARADLLASEEARRAVLTTIIADVATSYYNLREFDYELAIAKRTLASRQESLRLVRLRYERGVSNQLELRQSEELVYNASEQIPALERAIEIQENYISALTGRNPQPIERGQLLTEQVMPPTIPEGLASDLLERRPDIRAAEQDLLAANLRIDVAKKAWFPRITITAFLGFQSGELSTLLSPSRSIWSIVPEISQPIFNGGRIKSNIKYTEAQRNYLLASYEQAVQNAFREVASSLVSYRKVKEVRAQRELLVATLQDRSRLAYMRYNYGVATLLEALDADRELFNAELSLAQSHRDELLTVVGVYKALGGGWQ